MEIGFRLWEAGTSVTPFHRDLTGLLLTGLVQFCKKGGMPRYEYECNKCEKVFEVMQKFSDAPLAKCPECSGPVTKVFSLSSFALKGSGWYTTDYKRAGKSEAKSEAKSETKTESKSDTAATPKPVKPDGK